MADSNTDGKYTLDDLDELSEGLGKRLCSLLDEGAYGWSRFLSARKKIQKLLVENNLQADDVFVNHGTAEGQTISQAFEMTERNYQFMDQLG